MSVTVWRSLRGLLSLPPPPHGQRRDRVRFFFSFFLKKRLCYRILYLIHIDLFNTASVYLMEKLTDSIPRSAK